MHAERTSVKGPSLVGMALSVTQFREWVPEPELDEVAEREMAREAVARAIARGLSREAAVQCYGYRDGQGVLRHEE